MHILLNLLAKLRILQKRGWSLNIRQTKASKFGFSKATEILIQWLILHSMIAMMPERRMPVLPILQGRHACIISFRAKQRVGRM